MSLGRITPHQLSPAVSNSISRLTCLTATQLMHGTLGKWRTPRIVINTLPAGNSTNTDTKVSGSHYNIYSNMRTSLTVSVWELDKKKWRIYGNRTKLFRWAMWKHNSKHADEKQQPNSECLTTLSIPKKWCTSCEQEHTLCSLWSWQGENVTREATIILKSTLLAFFTLCFWSPGNPHFWCKCL